MAKAEIKKALKKIDAQQDQIGAFDFAKIAGKFSWKGDAVKQQNKLRSE